MNVLKISIVKNLKGELLTDGFVYINNDSVRCLQVPRTQPVKFRVGYSF